jgi:hypothetical protein
LREARGAETTVHFATKERAITTCLLQNSPKLTRN